MARTVFSTTFNYTPMLTGGDLTAGGFNPQTGRGWNRGSSTVGVSVVDAAYKADGSVIRQANRFQSLDTMLSGTIAGKDREPYFHNARTTRDLYDPSSGAGNVGMITRDLSSENWEIEITLTMLTPDTWPSGGAGNNDVWRHTCCGGIILFAPNSASGYNNMWPHYRIYWIRHSHNHSTKPAQQEIWCEYVAAERSCAPDDRGLLLTGESGNMEILGTQPAGATVFIPELEEEGSAQWRLVLRKNPNGDGIIMRAYFNEYLIGRSLPQGAQIAPGDLGWGRTKLESEGWMPVGASIETALERTVGLLSYQNAGIALALSVEPTWPAFGAVVLPQYRMGFDTMLVKDINDSARPFIFPKPELETEPTLTTATLEGEDAGTSATELTLEVDGLYVLDERMEVTEHEYTTGHFATVPHNSLSRKMVQFQIKIDGSTDLTTFKTFISTITSPGEDGVFTYDGETWRLIGVADIAAAGPEGTAYLVKFTAEQVNG